MQKNFINFLGLYGDNKIPFGVDFVHHEILETRSQQNDWTIQEHLHTDLFQVFFIQSGNGVLISAEQRITLNSPCILLIPNNHLHGFAFQSDISGDVLTFSAHFLEQVIKHSPHILLEINRLQQFSFESNPTVFKEMELLIHRIAKEFECKSPEKQMTLQLLSHLFLIELYRICVLQETKVVKSDNRTLNYFHNFQKLIKASIHQSKAISQYAKQLNITAVHLNRICQLLVQKSALQVVQEYVINEAKKYLLNTSYSIAEISYILDFKDPAYFCKLFKKQTGLSPSSFRNAKEKANYD